MAIPKKEAKEIGENMGVDWSVVDIDQFTRGINAEMRYKNIIGDDTNKAARLVLAHLKEKPDYYSKLENISTGRDERPEGGSWIDTVGEKIEKLSTKGIGEDINKSWDISIKKNDVTQFPPDEGETPERENQTEEVNAVEETRKRTPQYNNKEAHYAKSFDFNSIYDQIDDIIKDWRLIEGAPPLGTKTLGANIEYDLYYSLRDTVNNWFSAINKSTSPDDAIINFRKDMMSWSDDVVKDQLDNMHKLFSKGMTAGQRVTGVPVDKKYYGEVNYQTLRKTGIGGALDRFTNDVMNSVSNIVRKHHTIDHGIPLYRTKREIDSYLNKARDRTQLMVRTETAKFANSGMLKAWELDEDKYMYKYYWNNPDDERSKKISAVRKAGNPYSFDEIRFLWKNQEQKIDNTWFADQYNQRCSISRSAERLDKEFTGNRFIGYEADFVETT